jgi:hypothetical protein
MLEFAVLFMFFSFSNRGLRVFVFDLQIPLKALLGPQHSVARVVARRGPGGERHAVGPVGHRGLLAVKEPIGLPGVLPVARAGVVKDLPPRGLRQFLESDHRIVPLRILFRTGRAPTRH